MDLNRTPGPPGSDIGMQSMRRYYEDTMKRYMSDLQGRRSPSPDLAGNLNIRREGQALDLTSPPPVGGAPALDLSRQQQDGGGDEIPGSGEPFDRSDDDKSENNLDGRDDIQSWREFHRDLINETYAYWMSNYPRNNISCPDLKATFTW